MRQEIFQLTINMSPIIVQLESEDYPNRIFIQSLSSKLFSIYSFLLTSKLILLKTLESDREFIPSTLF